MSGSNGVRRESRQTDIFWGARFGMLTDQFKIQWMFNCDHPNPDSAQ
jgi:PhnB protein